MKVSMKFEGGAELARTLNALPTKVSKRVLIQALKSAGEPIRSDMAQRAPRAPGAPDIADKMLISAAKVEGLIDNDQAAAVAIGPIKELAYYGYFQEYGTMHHGAQPFARPAFDGGWQGALNSIRGSIWRALAAVGISTRSSPGGGGLL